VFHEYRDLGGRTGTERLQQRTPGAFQPALLGVAHHRGDRGGGRAGLEPRAELRADVALSGPPGGGDDANHLLADAYLHCLGEDSGQIGELSPDRRGRIGHDRPDVVLADCVGRGHHGLTEGRNRDRDRTGEGARRGGGDLMQIIARDDAGHHRQRCRPGGGSIHRPVLLWRVALNRPGALDHARA